MIIGGTIVKKGNKAILNVLVVDVDKENLTWKETVSIKEVNVDQFYVYSRLTASNIVDKIEEIGQKPVASTSSSKKKESLLKKRTHKAAVWVPVVATVVGGAAAAVYYFIMNKEDEGFASAPIANDLSLDDAPSRPQP